MSTTEIKFDLYQSVTDRIVSLLEQGTVPWRKPWSSAGPPMNAISKRPYQGINLWLLLSLNYESNLYLTWEQLKKIGGSVIKGEKGHTVIYWQWPDKEKEEESEPSGEQKNRNPRLRYHKVFNLSQCQGISSSVSASNYERQLDPIKACEVIVQNMEDRPGVMQGKKSACYDVKKDMIFIPSLNRFESSEAYYTTLFHELIHSTGHEKRLNRKTLNEMSEFGSEPYSNEELIAELGTCFLGSHTGILEKEITNSAAYIQGWLSKLKNDKRFIVTASTQSQKAVDFILNGKKQEQEKEVREETNI